MVAVEPADRLAVGLAPRGDAMHVERPLPGAWLIAHERAVGEALPSLREVSLDYLLRRRIERQAPAIEQDAALRQAADRAHVVAHEQHCPSALRDLGHFS